MLGPDLDAFYRIVADMDAAMDLWDDRVAEPPSGRVRGAANDAIDEMDKALRELYRLRERLVGQIREYDDATGRRVDRLLAERKGLPDDAA